MTPKPRELPKDSDWLEDSKKGRFSRYTTAPEESTWVCNNCGALDADPYDGGCSECGEEADE